MSAVSKANIDERALASTIRAWFRGQQGVTFRVAESIGLAREILAVLTGSADANARRTDKPLLDETELHRAKWAKYEREYILPCFGWASKVGLDLQTEVSRQAGKNCVEILVRHLIERVQRAENSSTIARIRNIINWQLGTERSKLDQIIAVLDGSTETSALRQPCGHDLQDLITICNMCRMLSDVDRIAKLEAENRYLRGLVASVSRDTTGRDWGAGFCINCDFCPWCREEDVCGHLDDCPAFTPDGKVRTVAP